MLEKTRRWVDEQSLLNLLCCNAAAGAAILQRVVPPFKTRSRYSGAHFEKQKWTREPAPLLLHYGVIQAVENPPQVVLTGPSPCAVSPG